jgi:glycosyltransferase involved in cell wall biosynthesis/peptidoglycan/xylan/chitin deacetylase (PgdA/CDA1 family)
MMMTNIGKPRVCLLTNMIAPSRVPLYRQLANHFDLSILHGKIEANRTWPELKVDGAQAKIIRGWQLRFERREDEKTFDTWFFHVEPGYATELIRRRPEAIITTEMGMRSVIALLYGAVIRKPVWVWWGGTIHTEQNIGYFRRVIRKIFSRVVCHWISYGLTSTEYLESIGVGRAKILQIQNSVDERIFSHPTSPAFEVIPKPVLLYVGRLVERKGVPAFFHAAAQLQSEGYLFSILLVGGGPKLPELRDLVQELGLNNVHFEGSLPPDRLRGCYRSADVLIFPTLGDVWGLVANEAILSGTKVLCSKFAGCATELFDGDSIFDPTDHDEFVNMLRKAVTGELPNPDPTRLSSSIEVADMIAKDILPIVRPQQRSVPVEARDVDESYLINQDSSSQNPAVYITTSWDDGHPLDFKIAELLSKYSLEGTFYVPLSNAERCVMDRARMRELSHTFEVGGHTVTHCDLKNVDASVARREIQACKTELEQITGFECPTFCFPKGHYQREHLLFVHDAGFKIARTVELMSIAPARRISGVSVIGTTLMAAPQSGLSYLKNSIKRMKLMNFIRYTRMRGENWRETFENVLREVTENGGVLHLWGHSWEIEQWNQWGELEKAFAAMASHRRIASFVPNSALSVSVPK